MNAWIAEWFMSKSGVGQQSWVERVGGDRRRPIPLWHAEGRASPVALAAVTGSRAMVGSAEEAGTGRTATRKTWAGVSYDAVREIGAYSVAGRRSGQLRTDRADSGLQQYAPSSQTMRAHRIRPEDDVEAQPLNAAEVAQAKLFEAMLRAEIAQLEQLARSMTARGRWSQQHRSGAGNPRNLWSSVRASREGIVYLGNSSGDSCPRVRPKTPGDGPNAPRS